jgi:hypothetical protein
LSHSSAKVKSSAASATTNPAIASVSATVSEDTGGVGEIPGVVFGLRYSLAMAARVQAVLYEPGLELPLQTQQWLMFEVPSVGARYWHGRTGYRVERVDPTDPVTLHLVRDRVWEDALHDGLPSEYVIDGGRRSDDGSWHFTVVRNGDRIAGWSFGEDCEATIRDAVSRVVASLPRAEAAG